MRKSTSIRTTSSIITFMLSAAIALPIWGDTLILRDGTTREGTLTGANPNTVTFRDRRGHNLRYSVRDVQAVQFGDGPYRANSGWGTRDQMPPDNQDNRGYNQNNRGYDQSRMERVVLAAGTEVSVRTNERIDVRNAVEGQTFSAQIEENVRDGDGSTVIPRGSDATLVVRRLDNDRDLILDVDSITVEGRRYQVSTADEELNQREGIGANNRTGQFVGGGAVLGAIIGAIAGGGKGAAIGAGAGAGAGALTQIITRGKEVHVPAESVIRFQLDRPLKLRLRQ